MGKKMKKRRGAFSALGVNALAGTPSGKGVAQIRKLSKTGKRPSGVFGGVLNGNERKLVFEEAAKIVSGVKKISETDMKLRPFVEQAVRKMVGGIQ